MSLEVAVLTFQDSLKQKEWGKIRDRFKSPEEIDDNPLSIPSRRLLDLFPSYQKVTHGPLIVKRIGLEKIRKECSHFNQWISQLEEL